MVRIHRTPTPPASLEREKAKNRGSYREQDVLAQLRADFHDKCYLCEMDELQSVEVEHLQPHQGDKDLKFAWKNLFLSCAHCNSVKNQRKYDNTILDCCLVEPEALLRQALENGTVVVRPLTQDETVQKTAELIEECFEKTNTGIRTLECETRKKALKQTMGLLYQTLGKYRKDPKGEALQVLRGMLDHKYKFSAFTRTYVRSHLDDYPGLAREVTL